MSWYWGSHDTAIGQCWIALWPFAITLRCETITPFGSLVEPDVYWRKRIGFGSWRAGESPNPCTSSVVSHPRSESMGVSLNIVANRCLVSRCERRNPLVVSAAFAPQSRAINLSFASPAPRLMGDG